MASTNTTSGLQPPDPPLLTFPPFPKPLEGVTIMPFKDFKPRGIQLFAQSRTLGDDGEEEDVELDGMGIPTVELRVKHTTDNCKSNTGKKRKKKKTTSAPEVPVKKLSWYEEWEEGEHLRLTRSRCDLSTRPSDRLFQSAIDFRTGRPWPPVTSGLNNIWDQFRLYIGLLVNPTVPAKRQAKMGEHGASPGSDSDDDDDFGLEMTDTVSQGSSLPRAMKRPRPRNLSLPTAENGDEDEDEALDEQKYDPEISEEKLTVFLNDPEKSVRIFLSSFMREHGLIWAERNLTYTPHLLSFFVRFVVRNRVLPEPTYQRGLKRALDTIETAKKELPLTYKVGHILPDGFSQACKELFGRKGTVNWTSIAVDLPQEEEPKLTVTDSLTGAQQNVTLPSEEQTRLKEVIEDNLDMEVDATQLQSVTPAWGALDGSNGWSSEWGVCNTGDAQAAWGTVEAGPPADDMGSTDPLAWAGSAPTWGYEAPTLITFLGPTVLPLTHTTGIVESSTRRVREVHPPTPPSEQPACNREEASGNWATSASGVEAELDALFSKVVLAPWGPEGGDISKPEIWQTSRGSVVDPNDPIQPYVVSDDETQRPHDPLKDDITLLVEPHLVDTLGLAPGLGLGAMWVQLVRRETVEEDIFPNNFGTEHARPKIFWYHEDLLGIFPSFYTPSQ